MSKNSLKYSILRSIMWFVYGGVVLWWWYAYPEDPYLRALSLSCIILWMIGSLVGLMASVDLKAKGKISGTLPFITNLNKAVVIGLFVSGIIVLLRVNNLLSVAPFFSVSPVQKLSMFVAFLLFVFAVTRIEENIWGSGILMTSHNALMNFRGVNKAKAFVLAIIFTSITFSVYHVVIGEVLVGLIVAAFIIRAVISVVNLYCMCYFPGLIIHRTIQAYAVGTIFNIDPVLAVGGVLAITILPYYLLPNVMKSVSA